MNATSAEQASAPVTEDALRSVLLAGERPSSPGPVLTSLTFGWRALLKIKHVPEQLVDVTMFPIMFTLMFTYLFGGALAGSTQEYLQFLLPGILVQANVMITMNTGITLNTDIQKGVFDRFRSLPVWRPSPLVGALLGDVMRYSIGSAIVITLGLVLGFRPEGGAVGVVLSVVLLLVFSFCLSWLWTMLSLILRTPNSVAGVSMMVMFPLTFVSNIFVDPKTMPGRMQAVVEVNPDHPRGDRGTRPNGRLGARRGNRLGARLVRTSRRGLRSHHHGPLPQQEVDAATASTGSKSTPTTRPTRPTPSPVQGPELPKLARSASDGGGSPRNSILVDMLRR